MHPKNIFKLRPLAIFLGSLLAVSGPCHLADNWRRQAVNERLVTDGIDVMATVEELSGGANTSARSARKGESHCRWRVRFDDVTCREIFPHACPDGISETPMIFLKEDPSVCRVLSRSAVAAELEQPSTAGLGWLITGIGLGLIALGMRRRQDQAPQVPLKDSK